ncbi:MAG: tRNA pseudouridine(38-40) synthase TruA [Salinivirgaceae bacterium]|nr:tRNA pseudouridine(38-40) synthase TruA [Salinivirgaceae bacterium]MDD4746541.1 tRNA pseudouridine(38-40) synthase TruA [Salinivirgaceae bacterium]MDY0280007.1 tRNA pseudouridine(38-40) synthase TruA [Salinivirgaceae bacterium]
MRYFIHLAYRGTNYSGWQIQNNAITVQGVLNDRLSKLLRQNIETVGAGRTDAGVHAIQFFAHFDVNTEIDDCQEITHRLNRMLPADIVVYKVFRVDVQSHARYDALSRTYHYVIEVAKNPFSCNLTTIRKKVPDIELMNQAANKLLNVSDFKSFCKIGSDNKTTICDVSFAQWTQPCENLYVFEIAADRFLRNMVRAIVGTLLEVGEHKITISDFEEIVNEHDRSKAGESVDPNGLYLSQIVYPYFKKIKIMSPFNFIL